jgi:hypothetical protein
MIEITSGLNPGEMVVTSGQFLIDSEARMRDSLAKMLRGESPVKTPDQKSLRTPAADESLAPYPLDVCVITGSPLDSMGGPVRYAHDGQEILFCCDGCIPEYESDPDAYLNQLTSPENNGVEP